MRHIVVLLIMSLPRTPLVGCVAQLDPDPFGLVHRGTLDNVRQIVSARLFLRM